MKPFRSFLVGLLIAGHAGTALAGGGVSVQSMPPVVVATFPKAGDTKVDPAIGEIRVTFSKNMMTDKIREAPPTEEKKARYGSKI